MKEKKKILYVITKGNFGGAQRYVFDLVTNLPNDKFEAVVACGIKDGNTLSQKLSGKNIKTVALENSEREINIKKDFKTFRDLIKIIKEEKPNIIHFNSSKVGLLGSLVVLYFKILNLFRTSNFEFRALFTSHGWAFNEQGRSVFSKIVFYLGHYLTVLICDKTIAVSEKTKKDVSFLPFIENKINVIHNGINNFDTLDKNEARLILTNKEKEKIILFSLSELHPNKGIDVALKALSLLPKETREKLIYTVAGDGEERKKLEKYISDLGIGESVKFLGFVSDAKKLLPGADIFLFPSRTENLPYAVLEAGSAGLPIIATSVGGIPEIIRDMQNGILIHAKNPKEIAEAILYILDHPKKQKEFGSEIQKTISNFFSLDKMLDATIKLYQ